MKKKAFTLIELLAVIVILVIVAVITAILVLNVIEDSKKSSVEASAQNIASSAELYYMNKLLKEEKIESIDLSKNILKYEGEQAKKGYFIFDEKGNASGKLYLNEYCIEINEKGKIESKKSSEKDCKIKIPSKITYKDGTEFYFNPTTGLACEKEDAVSTTGTKSGCMKWYAFLTSEESSEVNLILDHNTTATVAWSSSKTGTTSDAINAQLKLDTKEWKQLVNGITIPLTARIIKASEINQIAPTTEGKIWNVTNRSSYYYLHTGNNTKYEGEVGTNTYAWLFDNINGCEKYGCNVQQTDNKGYWTADYAGSISTASYAWYITEAGYLYIGYAVNNATNFGVRPVITIPKDIFDPSLVEIVEYKEYKDGEPVYFNPTIGRKCTEEDALANTKLSVGCMKWYAFLDNNKYYTTVKLLLDHNTSETTYHYIDKDQVEIGNSNWKYVINDVENKLETRLLSVEEITQIAPPAINFVKSDENTWYSFHKGLTRLDSMKVGTNTYAWLFDKLYGCTNYGCYEDIAEKYSGYFTSSKLDDYNVWYVSYAGSISDMTTTNYSGIRPVIELPKEIFNEEIKELKEYKEYKDGEAVYFNPTTGLACTKEEAVSTTGTKSGCMKFYAFLDYKYFDSVNLILDHNTTALVAWNTSSSGTTPTRANAQLSTDTSRWKQIVNGEEKKLTARLIKATEINKIVPTVPKTIWNLYTTNVTYYFQTGSRTSYSGNVGTNTYAWLFDNTNGCTSYGCNVEQSGNSGYWTSELAGTTKKAWGISNEGRFGTYDNTNSSTLGVRPVITVSKSVFAN